MEKKYRLRKDLTKVVNGKTLYRIQALKSFNDVKEGEIGGYVESEDNLSQEGNCWIYDDACVFDNARIEDSAIAAHYACVYSKGIVKGYAAVSDEGKVYGNAKIYGNWTVYHNGKVYGYAKIYDRVRVYHDAKVYGHAIIHAKSDICNTAEVCGNANLNHVLCTFGKHLGDEKTDIEDNKNVNTESVAIQVPDGYEIDKENSTFDCVKFKKKYEVNTWKDIKISQEELLKKDNNNYYADNKYVKSALAMAQFSLLIKFYGREITNEEWGDVKLPKHVITTDGYNIVKGKFYTQKVLLAFHKEEDRDRFLSFPENVQLVKDYLMIE